MSVQSINDAKHWRDRAAEMRALSAEMKDSQAQQIMLKLANDYEKLADRAEERTPRVLEGRRLAQSRKQRGRQFSDVRRNSRASSLVNNFAEDRLALSD